MNKQGRIGLWMVCGASACLLLLCGGLFAAFDLVFQLSCGWVLYLRRVLPQITVDWSSTAIAAVCLAGLAAGLHLFLRWLYGQIVKDRETANSRWQPRWTGMILALVVLLFTSGIAAVGIVHQTGWLISSPEPVMDASETWGAVNRRVHSCNNLKQIGLAAHKYNEVHHELPAGGTFDARGNGQHGWQTMLLPYMNQEALYNRINLKVPWNEPTNAEPFRTTVKDFLYPGIEEQTNDAGLALSHYAANVRLMGGGKPWSLDKLPDGTSQTMMAGEVWTAFKPWGDPTNWRDPARGLRTTPDSFGNPARRKVTEFLMADGSVRGVANTISREALRAVSTPDGGEPMSREW
jgi:hypothetical protein